MITFTQMKYFIEVIDRMSISKAAAAMFITQSAMSRQIALLEEEIGAELLKRGNRMISLTPAGKVVYECFVRMMRDYEKSVKEAVLLDREEFAKIAVGAFDQASIYTLFSEVFSRFTEEHPNIELQYSDYNLGDLWEVLQSGKIDVMITVKESLLNSKGIVVRDLYSIPRGYLCSNEHPLAKKDKITIEDLNHERLVITQEKCLQPYYRKILLGMEQAGAKMKPVFVPNFSTLLQKVRRNEGLMLMDYMGQYDYYKGLHHVLLEGVYDTMCIAYKKKTPEILSFVDAVFGFTSLNQICI